METDCSSDASPDRSDAFPFLERHDLVEINEALKIGDRWKELWRLLGLPDPHEASATKDHDWWCISPFAPSERTPSFHMSGKGWSCLSTGKNGSFVNLAAELWGMNVYHAAHRVRGALLGGGGIPPAATRLVSATSSAVRWAAKTEEQEPSPKNLPIRANLLKSRYFSFEHPEFGRRGLSRATLEALGIGYLDRPPRSGSRPDPLNGRLVFQVRGLREQEESGRLEPVVLTHMGRACTPEQEDGPWGKWYMYSGFRKSQELYSLDRLILDEAASYQAHEVEHVLVVEGAFDVAKLHEAGIYNAVAILGSDLSVDQICRLRLVDEMLGVNRFLFFFDRDEAGTRGTRKALAAFSGDDRQLDVVGYPRRVEQLTATLEAEAFDWEQTWRSASRGEVGIPEEIRDPCDFSVEQLVWLRQEGLI